MQSVRSTWIRHPTRDCVPCRPSSFVVSALSSPYSHRHRHHHRRQRWWAASWEMSTMTCFVSLVNSLLFSIAVVAVVVVVVTRIRSPARRVRWQRRGMCRPRRALARRWPWRSGATRCHPAKNVDRSTINQSIDPIIIIRITVSHFWSSSLMFHDLWLTGW